MGNPLVNYGKRETALPLVPMTDHGTMGDRIRALRNSKGLSLQALADKVGVTKAAVSKWETGGTQNMKLVNFLNLCQILGTFPNYLIFGAESPVATHPRPVSSEVQKRKPIGG